ncbi:nucleotidyltransferase domain-containing protein [Kribbella soli]|uniref:Nucleotidyltransferase family protein n=1 Tax=Kribbella soli TaxID=1124743 RepID=A0A4R0HPW1_9ACTN|nr:hypothetical protein [Kribbella soli]TCC12020.1 hypothetical protein E0H45_12560 [Kribbella soli]
MVRRSDLELVRYVVGRLEDAGVRAWVFGGWAAELLGLSAPRAHGDVDLLYPADDFGAVDGFLARGDVQEIEAKRFPHKRAFEVDGVMVELFLVQADEAGLFTDFWGVARHDWPADVFEVEAGGLRVASARAVTGYRAGWDELQAKLQGRRSG